MSIVCSLILLLFGIVFFLYKKGLFFIQFLYFWLTICPFLYALVFHLEASDFWNFGAWCNRCLLIICGISIFTNTKGLYEIKIGFIIYIIFCLYYVYLSLFRGVGIIEGIQYSYGCFLCIVCLPVILTRKTNCHNLLFYINVILWIEISCGLVQYFYPSFNYSSFVADCPDDLQPMCGTLYGNNTYIEFVVCLWYCVTYQILKNKRFGFSNILQTSLVLFLLIESGVRVALIAVCPLVIYLFFEFFIKRDGVIIRSRVLSTLLGACIALILIIGYFSGMGVTYTADATSGLERNMVIASVFLDNSFLLEHTTFALSYDVLRHFSENYLFGPGLLFIGNGYDGYINMAAGNITDATLAIFICETGIIGVVFLISFIYYLINCYCKGDFSVIIMIVSLLLLTVTDSGIFSLYNLMVVFTMIYINRNSKLHSISYGKNLNRRSEKI